MKSGNFQDEWELVLREEAAADMADDASTHDPAFDAEGVFKKINKTIKPARQIKMQPWLIGVAATLLITLSIGYLFLNNQATSFNHPAVLQLTTLAGQQKQITLADGTQIILNCRSTLTCTAQFDGNKREVYLDGEAFFNVKHDDKKPFIVHTGRLNVQVLGTSFNVQSYRADNRAVVSVASGKVGVNGAKPTSTYMLLPGDRLSYNRKNEFKKDNISIDEIMGWQKGILSFHLETIHDIVPVLERYYGITIHIDHEQKPEKQVTANFNRKTLPQVLEILSQTAGFNYVIHKNEVHIN